MDCGFRGRDCIPRRRVECSALMQKLLPSVNRPTRKAVCCVIGCTAYPFHPALIDIVGTMDCSGRISANPGALRFLASCMHFSRRMAS